MQKLMNSVMTISNFTDICDGDSRMLKKIEGHVVFESRDSEFRGSRIPLDPGGSTS